MRRFIEVRFRLPGLHRWPDAKGRVEYLNRVHRHEFHFECVAEVKHADRQLEFMTVQKEIKDWVQSVYWHGSQGLCLFGTMSCEMIAERILAQFPYLDAVTVTEDGENGSHVAR